MSDTETNPPNPELDDLREHYAALHSLLTTLLVALTLVSLTLTAFIGLQSRRAGKEVKAIRPQATQIIEAYQKQQPAIKKFVAQLAEYGKSHADFEPIMKKYGLNNLTATDATATPKIPTTPPTSAN